MEHNLNQQWQIRSSLTRNGVPSVSQVEALCLVRSPLGIEPNYTCGGIITKRVFGPTGSQLTTALSCIVQVSSQVEHFIHQFQTLLLTLSYPDLSPTDIRADNLMLDTTLPEYPSPVLIDSGALASNQIEKRSGLLSSDENAEDAVFILAMLPNLNAGKLIASHGQIFLGIARGPHHQQTMEWQIIVSDIHHFSTQREAIKIRAIYGDNRPDRTIGPQTKRLLS